MFFFGDVDQQYAVALSAVLEQPGPGIADKPLDEMSLSELRDALTYSLSVWKQVRDEGFPDEVLDHAKAYFDEAWMVIIELDEDYRRLFMERPLAIPGKDLKPYRDVIRGVRSEL